MQVRFWGVRGSIPVPDRAMMVYGGNTACVEVRCGSRLIVLDAGSGLRTLGHRLGPDPIDLDLLLTHCHVDHLIGLPFFAPAFRRQTSLRLWAGHLPPPGERLADVIAKFMDPPLLPITPTVFKANITYRDFNAGDQIDLGGGVHVATVALTHPGGATGYRIECGGRAVCYMTDHEHGPSGPSAALVAFARSADLLIYDAMYTPEEYATRVGWGHSTWPEALRLADAAGVRQVALFHHDPSRDDAALDAIANAASRLRPGTIAAREGLVIDLGGPGS